MVNDLVPTLNTLSFGVKIYTTHRLLFLPVSHEKENVKNKKALNDTS